MNYQIRAFLYISSFQNVKANKRLFAFTVGDYVAGLKIFDAVMRKIRKMPGRWPMKSMRLSI